MKKIFYMVALLLLMNISFSQTFIGSAAIKGGVLNVQLAKYSPTPAEAGKVFSVWIKAENIGIEPAKNATFILIPEYPFTLPNKNPIRNYGSITGLDDIQLEYRLLVDKDALNGTYKFKLNYTSDGRSFFEKEFSVTVEEDAKDVADLEALLVEIRPPAYALNSANLTLDIANRDKGTAFFTVVKIETDIAQIKRSEIFVGNLKSDDFDSVTFELDVKNVTGDFPVEIIMTYKDQDSNFIEEKDIVNIRITEKPYVVLETPLWIYAVYLLSAAVSIRLIVAPLIKYAWKLAKSTILPLKSLRKSYNRREK
jgi:hypothetical protein